MAGLTLVISVLVASLPAAAVASPSAGGGPPSQCLVPAGASSRPSAAPAEALFTVAETAATVDGTLVPLVAAPGAPGAPDDDEEADDADVASSDNPRRCSEVPLATPAVIDCHDERTSFWTAEMIGSCDMPRGAAPPSMRAGGPRRGSARCDALACGRGSSPLRTAAPAPDETWSLGPAPLRVRLFLVGTPLVFDAAVALRSVDGDRLDRPPRRA